MFEVCYGGLQLLCAVCPNFVTFCETAQLIRQPTKCQSTTGSSNTLHKWLPASSKSANKASLLVPYHKKYHLTDQKYFVTLQLNEQDLHQILELNQLLHQDWMLYLPICQKTVGHLESCDLNLMILDLRHLTYALWILTSSKGCRVSHGNLSNLQEVEFGFYKYHLSSSNGS
ncbi:hypothetical protein AGLY_004547 [Aphis glycines]|uniref:Uncharacterized protein n=1 Tax=Aphis glycines TaxID=307491 RepID=A0A6G0TYD3_APHGL|nr:hypothetical protein AGLY_004547 [Aphis glycines]